MQDFNSSILDDLFKNLSPDASKEKDADEIIVIVDRSGSMSSIREDAEGGLNTFIEEQKNEGNANLTLVQFDSVVEAVYSQIDIKNAKPYNLVPRNMTALYDAVGMTLANAEAIPTTGKKIVVIVTDGMENSSREYTREGVFARIEQLKEQGWEFLFLAANQDAMQTGRAMGISPGSTVQYDASAVGTQSAYFAASSYTTSLRGGVSLEETEARLKDVIQSSDGLSRSDLDDDSDD